MEADPYSDGILKTPIVIDNVNKILPFINIKGSGVIKAGFGGEEAPVKIFNS